MSSFLPIARRVRHVQRYVQLLEVIGRHGFADLAERIGMGALIDRGREILGAAPHGNHEKRPRQERVRLMLEELGPTYVKLGQVLSTRPDLIPQEWADEFKKLQDDVRGVEGITVATWAYWFGGKDPNDEKNFFANMAVDEKTFLDVYTEIQAPPEQVEAWKADPQGVLVGENLAKRMKLELGSKVTLIGTIFPGDWTFTVRGIYHSTSKAVDNSQFFFHWDYLNNALPDRRKGRLHLLPATDVRCESGSVRRAQRCERVDSVIEVPLVAGDDADPGAIGGKEFRRGAAHAPGSALYHHNCVLESEVHTIDSIFSVGSRAIDD